MKRNTLMLYSLLSIAFVLGSISATEVTKYKAHHHQIRPTIGELSSLVKPLIQPPYKPIEVDSLYADRNADDYLMTNAEIIGTQRNAEGLVEKPSMYESVIKPHSTSIMHANELNNIQAPHIMRQQEARILSLGEGQLAVPVQINTNSVIQDATMSNYETPLFLQRRHRRQNINIPLKDYIALRRAETEDARKLREKLLSEKSHKARIRTLKQEKQRLRDETKQLKNNIAAEMDNLMKSKSIANKLDGLLKKYDLKVKKDKLEQSKVVDREQFKRELKEKILREVEGIRSFGHKESLLSKVNQKDLNKIVKKIKKKLAK